MSDPIDSIMFEAILGMNKNEFLRKENLMRNPEWSENHGYCPVCKSEIVQNENGDLFCKNFSIQYETNGNGGCYWHRYADGLNYWSSPHEMFEAMAKVNPSFKKIYDGAKCGSNHQPQ